MTRGVRLYLVGSFVLVSLAGCGRGFFQSAEREPWRAEAEVACLKSGAVKESARTGPDRPDFRSRRLRRGISAQGRSARRKHRSFGFADEILRPPGEYRQPAALADSRAPAPAPPATIRQLPGNYSGDYRESGAAPAELCGAVERADFADRAGRSPRRRMTSICRRKARRERDRVARGYPARRPIRRATAIPRRRAVYAAPYSQSPAPRRCRGSVPRREIPSAPFGQVAMKPAATLACPIVSALDRWLADSVQPAAMRWFGVRVVEIKQISAYSCRGMNGNPHAHISEHAFGNALDIAAFTLADGRRITVEGGWRGMPEEQGFLRDVQAAACQQFNTVLAPGSNAHHEDHIHVDLMRRACRPHHLPAGRRVRRRGRGARRAAQSLRVTRSLFDGIARRPQSRCRAGSAAAARSTRKTSSRIIRSGQLRSS